MLSRFPSTFAIIVEEVSGSAAVDNAPPHPQTIRSGDFFVVGSSRTSACQFRHLGVYFFDGCGILGFDSEEQ